jgi:DNA-binding CsgD family transcriptional regulator
LFQESQSIIGRDGELVSVDGFLSAIEDGPTALLLDGEAGMGKTVLWKAGLAAASERSYRVLACRPIESETEMAYAALGDLLGDDAADALAELPGPQRRALEVALLLREPEEEQPAQRAVAVATLGVLAALSRERPLLVAIDDVQWLDPESESVLAFVARRLGHERIGVLVARRAETAVDVPLDLARAMPDGRFVQIRIEAMEASELDRLISTRLDARPSARLLERLHARSGGNPFFALEIGRSMLVGGALSDTGEDIPIPANLHDLVRDRLVRLPPRAREATEIAAALSRPTVELVDAVMGDSTEALDAAARAGVVEFDEGRVRFAHPLLASIAYTEIPPARRRTLHGRLAEILDDPEERGRHMALAAEGPDASVAAALDEAAARARARGAPGSAADLLEDARRLTPANAGADGRRRAVEAAARRFDAGEVDRARTLLEEVVPVAPRGRERAHVLARLGWVTAHQKGFRSGAEIFRAALLEHADDLPLRIEIEEGLAWCLHESESNQASEIHARSALALAESLGDPAILAGALSYVAFLEAVQGSGIPLEMSERAVQLGHSPEWSQILGRPDWIHAMLLQWAGELDAAHARFDSLHQAAVEGGDEHALPFILFHLARLEVLMGNWGPAGRHAEEAYEATLQSGQTSELPFSLLINALVNAHLGLVGPARLGIEEGLAIAESVDVLPAALELLAVRGFLELSLGNAAEADSTLARLAEAAEQAGYAEPALFRFHGDAIEAKITLGRRDEAEALLGQLDELALALHRTWAYTIACRSRALLSASNGDLRSAVDELERALVFHERLGEPFEHARTLLVLGTVHRRDRKKRAARDALEDALEMFDGLGAAVWSARTRAELDRVGGRAPTTEELTPTEQRIAELIASGLSYRETADALFISPKTVQWNLSKIYRKLGIRSRSELPARLSAEHGPHPR